MRLILAGAAAYAFITSPPVTPVAEASRNLDSAPYNGCTKPQAKDSIITSCAIVYRGRAQRLLWLLSSSLTLVVQARELKFSYETGRGVRWRRLCRAIVCRLLIQKKNKSYQNHLSRTKQGERKHCVQAWNRIGSRSTSPLISIQRLSSCRDCCARSHRKEMLSTP